MADIYDILARHFSHQTSAEEEKLIRKFRKNHPAEYANLLKLWEKGDVHVMNYDARKAWDQVRSQLSDKKQVGKVVPLHARRLPLYTKMIRVAAVAAIVIIGGLGANYLISNLGSKTIMAEASVTEKGKEVLLSDGSKVWLNENATLSYPKTMGEEERVVHLTGEAFFEVTSDSSRPFIVHTENSITKVLGTSFNINSRAGETEVTVNSGKVKVSTLADQYVVITPGFSAMVLGDVIEKSENTDPNYLSWKTGNFSFNNRRLDSVIEDLSAYYSKPVKLMPSVKNARLTASFDQFSLEDILAVIQLSCNVKISDLGNEILIESTQ